jgi:uncharacterized protein YkwD
VSPPPQGSRPSPAGTGRHRRPQPPSRPILLAVLAVLALLLGSGTAISLTAGEPAPKAGPEVAALGAAPATGTPTPPAPTASPSPSPEPEPEPEPEPAPEPEPVDEITALEDEVTRLTNRERIAANCEELRTDERLRTAARGHSQDMAANNYFDHNGLDGRSPFDRMRDAGHPDPTGENIAHGYPTPAAVMAGWMGSDGHRENLLTCEHQTIGVGLAYGPDGRPYWTQDFGQ